MPNDSEVVIFEFDFEGKTNARSLPNSSAQLEPEDVRKAEEGAVEVLNARADDLATKLQEELARVFQPLTTGPVIAECEVEFRYESNRSIIATIIATALGALGPFAADVAVAALAPPLGRLLESGFRRVFRRWQQGVEGEALSGHDATLEPFTMNVSTQQVFPITRPPSADRVPQPSPPETPASLTGQTSTPWLQVQQQTNPQPPAKVTSGAIETSGTHWLFPAIAIGTVVVIVVLAVILTIVIMQNP
jgi:hypothetical protein